MPIACLVFWVAVYWIKWMYTLRNQSDEENNHHLIEDHLLFYGQKLFQVTEHSLEKKKKKTTSWCRTTAKKPLGNGFQVKLQQNNSELSTSWWTESRQRLVLPANCSSYPSVKFAPCGFYSPQWRHHWEAETISKALQSQRETVHQSEAVRGRRAGFIETIKVCGVRCQWQARTAKMMETRLRTSSGNSFAQRFLKESEIHIILKNDLTNDYDDELGDPLIPNDTRVPPSESLTRKSSL